MIVFSAQDGVSGDGQVEAALNKSHASFGNLISCVEDRLALPLSRAVEEVA